MNALHLRYSRRRWVVVTAIVALLAAGGVLWWAHSAGSSSANNPTYRLVAATTGTIRQSITSTGTIAPAQQDAVNFTVSGKVTRVAVTAGQRVSAGTVLATIDTATLTANLAQAQATLATAQAKVAADNADSSTTSTQLAADTATATSAQGQVTAAHQAMSAATLTSPIAGVVAEVNLTVGQQVGDASGSSGTGSGSSGSGAGGSGSGVGGSGSGAGGSGSGGSNSSSSSSADQFLVISTTSWVVNATVDSAGVGLIATGNQAQIVPGSSPSVVYGTVASVGVMATTSSGVAAFPVVISVTGNPAGLHAGDTATVSLIYKQLSDVLVVPTAAVHTVNGQRVVYMVSGGKQVSHPVQVGLSSGGSTQITSGLNEGDQVEVAIPSTSNGGGSSASRGARPSGGTRQFPGGGNFGGGGGGGGFGGGGGGFGGFGGAGGGGGARSTGGG